MKKLIWLGVLMGFTGVLGATRTLAVPMLSFVPSSQTVEAPFTVDVVISGIDRPPSVGAFDLDVSYDSNIISATGVIFGPFLGDPGLFEALTDSTFPPGVADFAEVSLLLPSDLDALQPSSFTLATLSFSPKNLGTTSLTFSQVIVDDAFGAKLDIEPGTGTVTVTPEPGTLLLLGSGLAALRLRRRKELKL